MPLPAERDFWGASTQVEPSQKLNKGTGNGGLERQAATAMRADREAHTKRKGELCVSKRGRDGERGRRGGRERKG